MRPLKPQQLSPHHERDVLVLARSRPCEYIPRVLAALQSPADLHLFLELSPCGTVGDLFEAQADKAGLPESWVVHWIAQVVEALDWTHETARCAHRDVKPGNILLRSDGHVLLTDFGSAAPLHGRRVDPAYCRTPAGTVDYMAPEILLAHQAALAAADGEATTSEAGYGPEVDYWSLGSSMYELLYGVAPFFAPAIADTYDRIVKHEQFLRFPDADVSAESVDLFRQCVTSRTS